MSWRALSIQQPWAWLIVHGHKAVENRTWPTNFRGPFLVHAGKTFDNDGYRWVLRSGLAPDGFPAEHHFKRGGIVGAARLVQCLPPLRGASCDDPWRDPDQYAFVIEDATPMLFTPCRGQLGFFKVNGGH